MRKTTFMRSGLLCFALAVASAGSLAAQDRGADRAVYHNLGYGTEVGQAVIFILAEGVEVGGDRENRAIEITGPATRSAAVGNCYAGEVKFQPARLVHRHGAEPPIETEVAVLYPDNTLVPQQILLGSFRPGGPCGPGFQIQRGHVMNTGY